MVDGSEMMRIRDGTVGINETNPTATLHVNDVGTTQPAIFVENAGSSEGDFAVQDGEIMQSGHWDGSSFTERFRFGTVGQLGIGGANYGSKGQVIVSQGSGSAPQWEGGSVPSGGIIIWSGSISSIPDGYRLCNGSNGTPDLRNRFVVGAWSDGASAAWPNIPPGEADGNATITLSTSQLPSHRHLTFRSGNHGQLRNGSNLSSNNTPGSGSGASNLYEGYNINSSNSNANVGRSSAVGNGASINILPPYYGLAFIMKT